MVWYSSKNEWTIKIFSITVTVSLVFRVNLQRVMLLNYEKYLQNYSRFLPLKQSLLLKENLGGKNKGKEKK